MAAPRRPYIYPVSTVREAKSVLEPEFQPDLFDDQDLYVNLDEIRNREYLNDLFFILGYNQEKQSFDTTADFVKIIFSGHRGSGKSAELRRVDNELCNPDRYFTIFIDLENEVEVGSFQYADFFSLIIHKLIEELEKHQIKGGVSRLQQLAEKLLAGKAEETKINKNTLKSDTELGAEAGFKLFGIGGKASFKEVFSGENEISTAIRREIRQNTLELVYNLNAELVDTRMAIQDNGKGNDILIIIDGSEKIQSEVYEDLFVKNGNIISELSVNMLAAVPISAFFQIEKAPFKFSNRYTVPMIKLDGNKRAEVLMTEIIGKRIDLSLFINDDALSTCIEYSGGCIRQLFQVVYTSFKKSLGEKIGQNHVELAVRELGKYLWEYLDNEHLKVLAEVNYRPAEKKVSELLYMLILLKYNGKIKINPLLQEYPDFKEWQTKQTK